MKNFIISAFLLISILSYGREVKVACVGNSVTYGHGIEDREHNSYPVQLQNMLGKDYKVVNFGRSGATLLNKGHRPYTNQKEYAAALDFKADIVVIHLGLNDTDPRNWPCYRDEFIMDYSALIASFRNANPSCKVYICRMTPIGHRHNRFKSGTRDWYWQIQNEIETVARINGTPLIDLQYPLYNRPDLMPDALHPNKEGAAIIASKVYGYITGDYGGLKVSPILSDNMVLQRDTPLIISGTADTGEKVAVKLDNDKLESVSGDDGKWSVTFPSQKAGGPHRLTISTKGESYNFSNIMFGDVWLCSGQSNMRFMVKEGISSEKQEAMKGDSNIRIMNMTPRYSTGNVTYDSTALSNVSNLHFFNNDGWKSASDTALADFSAVAYFFGKMLSDSLNIPIGLINNSVGGSPIEAWIDRKSLEFEFPDILYNWRKSDFIQPWVRGRADLNLKGSSNPLQRHPFDPSYLYESGIIPLSGISIKGVIWYQGEANAHNIETHEKMFPILVESWRTEFGNNIPFYYVQLSSMNRPTWTWFRDSQRRLMEVVPNCGMAVSSDSGDSTDVHPRKKKDVGERLARWALNETYNCNITPSGPLFKSVEFADGAAFLTFDYSEGMHSSDGGPLVCFEIAETPGHYHEAQAQVVGDKIKVWHDGIKNPKYVRYGWQPFTRANLVNGDGLPASTFRYCESPLNSLLLPPAE